MRKQAFILLFFISICSSCDFTTILDELESTSLENCQTDTSNIPSINIIWEQDLDLNEAKVFSPIIYKDFVLVGKENT